jgi:hypothetical protein
VFTDGAFGTFVVALVSGPVREEAAVPRLERRAQA